MTISKSHNLILILSLLMMGCVTGPDYERDNPNDPGSDNFIPPTPKWVDNLSGQFMFDTEEKSITLRWLDGEYEEGFVIEKKLGDEGSFTELARLSKDDTTYVDDSGFFADPTMYRVSTFISSAVEDSVDYTSEPLEFTVNFNTLWGIGYSFNEENSQVEAFIDRREFDNYVTYESGFILEYKPASEQENWELIDTLYWGEYNLERITQDVPQNIFHAQYRLTRFLITGEDQIQVLDTNSMDELIRDIRDPDFEMVDELTTNIFWDHDYDPEGVIIHIRSDDEITQLDTVYAGIENQSLTYTNLFTAPGRKTVGVQPFANSNYGRVVWLGFERLIVNNPPRGLVIKDNSSGGVELKWSEGRPSIPVSGYIINRSATDDLLSPYDTVDAGVNTYTDNQLLTSQSYKYSVRSYLSIPDDSLRIRVQKAFVDEQVTFRDKYYDRIFESEFGDHYAAYDQDNKLLDVFNKSNQLIRSIELQIPSNIPDRIRALQIVRFNRDQTILAFQTIAQSNEYWNHKRLSVIDLNSGSYYTLNNANYSQVRNIFFPSDTDTLFIDYRGTIRKFDLQSESETGQITDFEDTAQLMGLLDSRTLILRRIGDTSELYLYNTGSESRTVIQVGGFFLKNVDHTEEVLTYTTGDGLYTYDLTTQSKQFITGNINFNNSSILNKISDSSLWYYSDFGSDKNVYDEATDQSFNINFSIPDDSNFASLIARQLYYDMSSDRFNLVTVTGLHSFRYTEGWVTY